jgi:hypothetical protein
MGATQLETQLIVLELVLIDLYVIAQFSPWMLHPSHQIPEIPVKLLMPYELQEIGLIDFNLFQVMSSMTEEVSSLPILIFEDSLFHSPDRHCLKVCT